jgi:hypothetical protein
MTTARAELNRTLGLAINREVWNEGAIVKMKVRDEAARTVRCDRQPDRSAAGHRGSKR